MSDEADGQQPLEPAFEHVDEVRDWLARLQGTRVALDIEGDGMFRYRARLCTVQLGDPARTAVVDTLRVDVGEALGALLADASVTKVVHDASFDARMLADAGAPLRGLFDTGIASRFLAYPATGLSALLERHFGIALDKEPQQADWGERPLTSELLHYLHADVRHLLPLSDLLAEELRDKGIEAEFQVECDYMLEQAREAFADPRPLWSRVKGAAALRGQARAVLREVTLAREALAEARDVPPGRLVPAGLLVELSTRRPQSAVQLDKLLRRMRLEAAEKRELLAAIARGLSAQDAPADEVALAFPPAPPQELRNLHKRRRTTLMEFRDAEAKRRDIDVQVVLPGHCVKDLMALEEATEAALASVPGLGDCRRERYGEALLEALRKAESPG